MDRQYLCIAGLVLLTLAGCQGKGDGTTQTSAGTSASGGESAAGPHLVERPPTPTTIVETPRAAATPNPAPVSPGPQAGFPPNPEFQPANPGYSASGFPAYEPAVDITPVPSPVDGFNPLRLSEEPEAATATQSPVSPRAGNPLRSFGSAHSFSAGSEPTPRMAAGSAPRDWPPAAAADPPPAAPESSFPAAAELGSAEPGSAEPGSAGPEASFSSQPMPLMASAAPEESHALASPSRSINVMAKAAGADASAGSASPAQPSTTPYDVVQVFYGTDREATEPPAGDLPAQAARFLPTLASFLVTLCLAMVALAKRRTGLWLLAGGGLIVTAALALQATGGTLSIIRRSGHEGLRYTSNRAPDGRVQVGICDVAIPKTHMPGELESPSIFRGEVKEDAAKHVVLAKTERLGNEQFYELLRQRVAASPRGEVFIFIHGFNVTFEDAARRTAQIHKDLKFEGAPVFFSWPAHDKFILTYMADANNIPWTVPHLKQFLLEVVHESGAKSINLVAHSMGNRALAATLRELELEFKQDARFFNQVVLAAPDIDSDEFRTIIAPNMQKTANHFTLYASARDEALAASQLAHFGPRAGDAGHGLVVVPGIDTIDVTAIDTSPWGHTYYGSSDPVLRDLGLVIMQGVLPPHRGWLLPAEAGGLPYWVFQPQTTAARDLPTTPR